MLSIQERAELTKSFRVNVIIFAALLASVGVYLGVCFVFGELEKPRLELGILRMMVFVLTGVSAAFLLISWYFRYGFQRKKMLEIIEKNTSADRMDTLRKMVNAFGGPFIISLAILESIALLGVILLFLGCRIEIACCFIGLSSVSMLYFRPKFEEIEKMADII